MTKLSTPITAPRISDTIKAIPAGGKRTYAAADLGSIACVRAVASRLNSTDAAYKYTVATEDNGVTMTITKSHKTN